MNKRFLRVVRSVHDNASDFVASEFKGAEYIAGGCFGSAYHHPTDASKVIKVTIGYDRAYITYVRHILHLRKRNPWFPVIHDAYLVMSEPRIRDNYEAIGPYYKASAARRNACWLVVIMDRLEAFDDKPSEPLTEVYYKLSVNAGDVRYSSGTTTGLTSALRNIGREATRLDKVAEALLNRMLKRYRFSPDMHSGNAMWSGRQLVLTDPFCG